MVIGVLGSEIKSRGNSPTKHRAYLDLRPFDALIMNPYQFTTSVLINPSTSHPPNVNKLEQLRHISEPPRPDAFLMIISSRWYEV